MPGFIPTKKLRRKGGKGAKPADPKKPFQPEIGKGLTKRGGRNRRKKLKFVVKPVDDD